MQKLEMKILKLHDGDGNKKELSKYAKKLCKCDMLSEIGSIRNELNELSSSVHDSQRGLFGDHNVLAERLNDIEDTLLDIKDEN